MQHSAMPPRNKGPSVFTTTDRLQGYRVTGEIAVFQTPKLRGAVAPPLEAYAGLKRITPIASAWSCPSRVKRQEFLALHGVHCTLFHLPLPPSFAEFDLLKVHIGTRHASASVSIPINKLVRALVKRHYVKPI